MPSLVIGYDALAPNESKVCEGGAFHGSVPMDLPCRNKNDGSGWDDAFLFFGGYDAFSFRNVQNLLIIVDVKLVSGSRTERDRRDRRSSRGAGSIIILDTRTFCDDRVSRGINHGLHFI